MNNRATKIAVLMAVKNGFAYLPQQIDSILNQQHCQVSVFVSDDLSTDGSLELLQSYTVRNKNINLLPTGLPSGSSAKNFYRLTTEVETEGFDYIAFSDQDDIWLPNKLMRHIELAKEHNADGVSSNVIAFWPDGREFLLEKAQPQQKFDFLFESAGPGCTYLMTSRLFCKIREQLLDNNSPAKEVAFHDWLAYAICRAYGYHWFIDSEPSIRYRQHPSNTYGANVGLNAKWLRLRQLKQRWYRDEIIRIAAVCYKISAEPDIDRLIQVLEKNSLSARLMLLGFVPSSRRKLLDRCLLAGAIVAGVF